MAKVFLGVGHGGSDPGASANGFKEKDLNLSIALACRDELVRHGVNVKMSRQQDENDPLTEEIRECNAFGPDLAIDIHNNAGGGDGVEAYYKHTGGTSKILANNVLSEITKIGQNSRGAKVKLNDQGGDWFGFVRQIKAPSILLECAFIDTSDVQIIDTESERKTMGIAVAKGILKTLGIAHKDGSSGPSIPTTSEDLYRVQTGAFRNKDNADKMLSRVKTAGFNAFLVQIDGLYKIQVGAYAKRDNAEAMAEKVRASGFDAYIATTGAAAVPTQPKKKSIDEIANEVLKGEWGNGQERKNRLTDAGYNYSEVQNKVNEILGLNKKSIEEIAREVIRGEWGNGQERKNRLTAAGYNYSEVQKKVNELL